MKEHASETGHAVDCKNVAPCQSTLIAVYKKREVCSQESSTKHSHHHRRVQSPRTTIAGNKGVPSQLVVHTLHSAVHAHLFWVLCPRIKYVELGFQAAHHKLVHWDVLPVKLHTTHAVLHICLPPDLQRTSKV